MGTTVHRKMAEGTDGNGRTTRNARTRDPSRGRREPCTRQPFPALFDGCVAATTFSERTVLPLRRRWRCPLPKRRAGAVSVEGSRGAATSVQTRTASGENADCVLPGRQSDGAVSDREVYVSRLHLSAAQGGR